MPLVDYIDISRIKELKSTTKSETLKEMVELMNSSEMITDKDEFLRKIVEREKILSTGIGLGIAVPHVKLASVKDFVIGIGVSRKGIPYDAIDGGDVHIIVMIGASEAQKDEYVKVLAKIVLVLKNEKTRHRIIHADCPEEIYGVFEGR